ncbi:hypothetical protein Q5P01_003465 [Channa striata]|uniref:Uncharacterized protein n=1 Tax=Channa striata TaxID=64152 RepID=A0AA88NSJ0_CHASR|nr:hypothetical protein Q5P01_003465 [Channa striata]
MAIWQRAFTCHPSTPPTAPFSSTPPQRRSRDGGIDRPYHKDRERQRERDGEQRPCRSKEDHRARSGDREQEEERERDLERDREGWSFHPHPHQQKSHSQPSTVKPKSRPSPPQPHCLPGGGAGSLHGPEADRGSRDEEGSSTPSERKCRQTEEERHPGPIIWDPPHGLRPFPCTPAVHRWSTPPLKTQRACQIAVSAPTEHSPDLASHFYTVSRLTMDILEKRQ